MLPNVFATVAALHSFAFWASDQEASAAFVLVAAATVLRCDLLLLVLCTGLSWLITRRLTLCQCVRIGASAVTLSLLATVPLDSLLWRQLLWPEGVVLYYNTALNKSSDWGVSPWYWYWLSALPKAMALTMCLVPLAAIRIPERAQALELKLRRKPTSARAPLIDATWLPFLLPALGFVGLYSCLGHKEVRFLFPVLPLFNLSAAIGLARVHNLRFPGKDDKPVGWAVRFMYVGGVAVLLLTLAASVVFVLVSRSNYPGGVALKELTNLVQASGPERAIVYIDVASAMTGVSLFGQRDAQRRAPRTIWTFHKAGYEAQHAEIKDISAYTHILTERRDIPKGFRTVATVQGHPRLDMKRFRISTSQAIAILQRVGIN
jgi:alpha-1,6-mannosyltransferase